MYNLLQRIECLLVRLIDTMEKQEDKKPDSLPETLAAIKKEIHERFTKKNLPAQEIPKDHGPAMTKGEYGADPVNQGYSQ